jgi:hypothetical protein
MDIDKIRLLQYENLRKYFNENLVDPILGKGYYNYGMDVYSCDEIITEDIKAKFEWLNFERKAYKIGLIVSLVLLGLSLAIN